MDSLSPKSRRSVRRLGVIGGGLSALCAVVLLYSMWLGHKNKQIEVQKFSRNDPATAAQLRARAGKSLAPVKNGAPNARAQALNGSAPAHPGSNVDGVMEASVSLPPGKTGSAALVPGGAPLKGGAKAGAKSALDVAPDADADFGITTPTPSQYSYNPDNRRDPFQSLLKGEFLGEHGEEGQPLVDVGDLKLMGVLHKNNEYFAMVEDSKGHGFTLRAGDPVLNGRVTQIEHDCLTVNLSSYGESQTVKLHLNNASAESR